MINKNNVITQQYFLKMKNTQFNPSFQGKVTFDLDKHVVKKMTNEELSKLNFIKDYLTKGEGKKVIEELPKSELKVDVYDKFVGGISASGAFIREDKTKLIFKNWSLNDVKDQKIKSDIADIATEAKADIAAERKEFQDLKFYQKVIRVISSFMSN